MLTILLITAISCLTGASFVDNGTVVTLDGIPYYAGGVSIGQLGSNCSRRATLAAAALPGHELFPMTVIETNSANFQTSELLNTTTRYEREDDVFQRAFLRTIYVRSIGTMQPAINVTSLADTLSEMNTVLLMSAGGLIGNVVSGATGPVIGNVPKGPYFVSSSSGNIYKAHRLYPDDYLAFIQGAISDENGGYVSLPAVTENVMAKSVAVPSKLYFTATNEKPLAGFRFGVKDIYHVKGLGTSGGNRAYFYLYGTQNITAPSIQSLIDLGAVLVGKMGTVQFANGDRPTADWVDLHAPFNPRGDGYQDPSGSSTGPGAGVAGYEWLDLAVGSDTGGSMRGPAGSDGIFGNRPSTGAISMDHVIPLSPVSDTAGIFAKSGSLWAKATQAWYPGMASNYTSYPRTIYRAVAPGEWTSGQLTPEVASLVDSWFQKLESFMGVNATWANYTALWDQTHGDAPENLAEMLYLTYGVYVSHDQWQLLGRSFFEEYAAQHGGRRPYINPGPLARWEWGQIHATDEVYAQGLHNISLFKTWYETEGYGRHDSESCSEGLYIYAWGIGEPSYRDSYSFQAPTTPPLGFGESSVPIMAGVPEVVVPIGEVPYNSTVTLQTEYLPVSMALRMARGCDYVLASLVRDLESAGVLRAVAAGSRLYL
ncbi:Glutamyl-tRNA subunit a [Pleurostoma richardsiae]|uniref:Glutamyl-tRNA subunit a n=1 Tax=Pleurostoma richardsiae TaxID=41990 RepID=A0AA38R2J9_9PEZI|nr:Glutamyl-tRNA subunit a [Pleurostoma richardsiae]